VLYGKAHRTRQCSAPGGSSRRGLARRLSRFTGRKDRLGRITKQGDSYLRHLLVIGARNVVRYPKARSRVAGGWIEALLERRRPMVVAIAVANKLARIVWAMMTTGNSIGLSSRPDLPRMLAT
jgi:hypothetical protein